MKAGSFNDKLTQMSRLVFEIPISLSCRTLLDHVKHHFTEKVTESRIYELTMTAHTCYHVRVPRSLSPMAATSVIMIRHSTRMEHSSSVTMTTNMAAVSVIMISRSTRMEHSSRVTMTTNMAAVSVIMIGCRACMECIFPPCVDLPCLCSEARIRWLVSIST